MLQPGAFGVPASVTIDHINIWDKDNPIIGASSLDWSRLKTPLTFKT